MCGITGLITSNPELADLNIVKKMNDSISHRGPDGEGFFQEKGVIFGHRRLSIIELSELGSQPMHKHGFTITYNGEIYNYIEIRKTLETKGYHFKSKSDTEVILSAYHYWGQNCVNYFNGMWAFAIYDKKRKIVFCSRDRYGIKPFYYFYTSDFFLFGSEIRQLLTHSKVNKILNKKIASDFLISSVVDHTNETFFKNIFKLPPAHNFVINCNTLQIKKSQYYYLGQHYEYHNCDFEELFSNSVKLRLRSDVKIGSCLSGGLDSSSIVSIAANLLGEKKNCFHTITSVPFDGSFDESLFAKKLTEKLSLIENIIKPTPIEFKNEYINVLKAQEEPFMTPSIFMQYFIMKKAKDIGIKVLLDGQGGDEVLCGYEKYFVAIIYKMLKEGKLQSTFKIIYQLISKNQNISKSFLIKNLIKGFAPFIPSQNIRNAQNKCLVSNSNTFIAMNELYRSPELFKLKDITHFNLPALLRFEDKNSMSFSIESRLPFLDFRIVEWSLQYQSYDFLENGLGKKHLRNLKLLPNFISNRKSKYNFNSPSTILKNPLLWKEDCFKTWYDLNFGSNNLDKSDLFTI